MFWKVVVALILAFIAINVLVLIWQNNRKPELGVQADGELAALSNKPNCVSSYVDGDRHVPALVMGGDLPATMAAIEHAFDRLGNIEVVKQEGPYIRAVATTKLMRYKDDIELLVDVDERVVHYRSSSRAGYSDMGVNKTRYDTFASFYREAL